MAFTFGPMLRTKRFKDLEPGASFLLTTDDGSRQLCLKARAPEGDFILVFEGMEVDVGEAQPHFFDARFYGDREVVELPDLEFDVTGGPFGLPVPGKLSSGALVTDGSGEFWMCAKLFGGGRQWSFISLSTGGFGNPANYEAYPTWLLLWRKPGAKEPIVLAARQ